MPVAGATTRGNCGEFKPVAPYPPFASGTGGWNHPVVGNGAGIVDHIGDPDPKSISFIGKLLSADVLHTEVHREHRATVSVSRCLRWVRPRTLNALHHLSLLTGEGRGQRRQRHERRTKRAANRRRERQTRHALSDLLKRSLLKLLDLLRQELNQVLDLLELCRHQLKQLLNLRLLDVLELKHPLQLIRYGLPRLDKLLQRLPVLLGSEWIGSHALTGDRSISPRRWLLRKVSRRSDSKRDSHLTSSNDRVVRGWRSQAA